MRNRSCQTRIHGPAVPVYIYSHCIHGIAGPVYTVLPDLYTMYSVYTVMADGDRRRSIQCINLNISYSFNRIPLLF